MDHSQNILISLICDPPTLLRRVDQHSAEFRELRDTIKANGLLNSICVRPHPQKPGYYQVVDGMYRLTICRDLGWETIPCVVKEVTDESLIALQIIANAVRPETTVTEYARQLKRLLEIYPEIAIPDLSVMIGRSIAWIYAQLSLLNVHQDTQAMIDRGEIPLMNAYMLAKIPLSVQRNYVEPAMVMAASEFKQLAADVVRKFMENAREGKLETHFGGEADLTPRPYLRSLKIIKAEYERMNTAAVMLHTEKCRTPFDGWKAALKWALNLDEASVSKRVAREVMKHESLKLRRQTDI
jgi:ParB/RepB/Spo0J family partition protein